MVRIASLAFVVVLGIASASAADAPKPKAPEPGTSVEMPYLIAPMIVDGKLTGNAYVSNKVIATSPAAASDIRNLTPFIQDAFVRDVNAKPIGKDSDPATVDQAGLQVRLLADARRIVGAGKVADLKIIQVQVNPIRPDGPP
ncbi:MAG TPA: hypothetical protein VHU87_09620 [Rhizomicrobium sp.]|jgi:hypothetical protein|nr:hypothetical protein [Rhizomicrobium sp.]